MEGNAGCGAFLDYYHDASVGWLIYIEIKMKNILANKNILVVGLGKTGLSAMRWLLKQHANVFMADSRTNPPGIDDLMRAMPDMKIYAGPFEEEIFLAADLIVVSPGVSLQEPVLKSAKAKGIEILGDIELFAQHRPHYAKVIAITGSNGKTTVTTLVGEMCKKAGLNTVVAGNIGLPVLDTLEADFVDVYVLELSSFQLETTYSLKADVATVLNVSEDHMDRYDSVEAYAKAKGRIYENATLAVVNRDDSWSKALATSEQVSFGLDKAPHHSDYGLVEINGFWLSSGKRKLMPISDLKMAGQHNIANVLAAAALANSIGVDRSAIISTIRQFKGLPHRVEWVANINDVDFFDDSKGTNVGATCAAIKGMSKNGKPQKVVLIAGGDGKGQDFTPLVDAVKQNARAVVLFGRDAPLMESVLLATDVPLYDAISLQEAVVIAAKLAKSADAVLLSPACASFDMFANYIHRAEVFVEAVKGLEAEATC
jgi:UDP-N-acetylmuramoylalanine--D-glutamate ligase